MILQEDCGPTITPFDEVLRLEMADLKSDKVKANSFVSYFLVCAYTNVQGIRLEHHVELFLRSTNMAQHMRWIGSAW